MAASSSGWRATRGALGTMEYRSPKVSTSNTTGSGPTVVRIETSTPGVTAIFKIRPGPPNHVSVHPPLSQIRTGADASITTQHPPSCSPTGMTARSRSEREVRARRREVHGPDNAVDRPV